MRGTKESLIALLSQKSIHHDLAFLQLKQTLVDLEMQLGHDLTMEQILEIANSEGGTMALFGPIATKAVRKVKVQINAAKARMK